MDDQRIETRSALGLEDLARPRGIRCVRGEAVTRLGRDRDGASRIKRGFGNGRSRRTAGRASCAAATGLRQVWSGGFALDQRSGSISSRFMRARTSGHSSLTKRLRQIAEAGHRRQRDITDAALPFVVRNPGRPWRPGVGRLLGSEGADRRKRVAVTILAGKDRVGDGFAEADVNWLFVLGSERHAVVIQHCAKRSRFNKALRRLPRPPNAFERGTRAVLQLKPGMADEDEARDPLARLAKCGPNVIRISPPASQPTRGIAEAWAASSRFIPAAPHDNVSPITGSCAPRSARSTARPTCPGNGPTRSLFDDGLP